MDRADLNGGARLAKELDNSLDGGLRQGADVFGIVDGEVGFPIVLIGGQLGVGHRGQNRRPDGLETAAIGPAVFIAQPIAPVHAPARLVVAEIERPVLADDGIDGPHSRDVLAPAGGPSGHGHDPQTRTAHPFERRVGKRR